MGSHFTESSPGLRLTRVVASIGVIFALAGPVTSAEAAADGPDCASQPPAPTGPGVFQPRPLSQPVYGVSSPADDPSQRLYVPTPHGNMYVEVYLPTENDGQLPPERMPTILNINPYRTVEHADPVLEPSGVSPVGDPHYNNLAQCFVPRGYVVAIAHVLGTGNSGGCFDFRGRREVEANLRVIEDLAHRGWSNGEIGLWGTSYEAGSAAATLASGDPRALRHVRAFLGESVGTTHYEWAVGQDGVPQPGLFHATQAVHLGISMSPGEDVSSGSQPIPRPADCWASQMGPAETSGDFTPYLAERETRRGAPNIAAATLLYQGYLDSNPAPLSAVGFFERIPEETPHKMIVGWAGHGNLRPDRWPMHVAWFDRYLMGLDTGVERWPDVQIEDRTHAWRGERDWPAIGGASGQLALGPNGTLGSLDPLGEDGPVQQPILVAQGHSPFTYSTGPLPGRFHLSGMPVLDLWVKLTDPNTYITAELKAFDAEGSPLSEFESVTSWGWRSARHLDPIADGYFQQAAAQEPDITRPVRIPIRMMPTEMVVPAEGSLRLEIGTVMAAPPSTPSGSTGSVTVLHDCAHPSTLRFTMPKRKAEWLRVAAADGTFPELPEKTQDVDGGGLAGQKVCGDRPADPQRIVRMD